MMGGLDSWAGAVAQHATCANTKWTCKENVRQSDGEKGEIKEERWAREKINWWKSETNGKMKMSGRHFGNLVLQKK